MKKLIYIVAIVLVGCGVPHKDYERIVIERDSIKNELSMLIQRVHTLQDSIVLLSYPANQRYEIAVSLIKQGELDSALVEIHNLQRLFPKSKEAAACETQLKLISQRKELLKREESVDEPKVLRFLKIIALLPLQIKMVKLENAPLAVLVMGEPLLLIIVMMLANIHIEQQTRITHLFYLQ